MLALLLWTGNAVQRYMLLPSDADFLPCLVTSNKES